MAYNPRKVYTDASSFFIGSTDPEKVDTGETLEVAGRLSPVLLCRSEILGFADALGLRLIEHEPLVEENAALRAENEQLKVDLASRALNEEEVAAAKAITANMRRNSELAAQFA